MHKGKFVKKISVRLFFLQNDFPPHCHMTLPLQACATITSMRFLHVGAMANLKGNAT